jgi:hypothetical protein
MRRREFVAALGSVVATPRIAIAQEPLHRITLLARYPEGDPTGPPTLGPSIALYVFRYSAVVC